MNVIRKYSLILFLLIFGIIIGVAGSSFYHSKTSNVNADLVSYYLQAARLDAYLTAISSERRNDEVSMEVFINCAAQDLHTWVTQDREVLSGYKKMYGKNDVYRAIKYQSEMLDHVKQDWSTNGKYNCKNAGWLGKSGLD